MASSKANEAPRRGGIPRGLKRDGPAILSYGFRPFFLGAGAWAFIAMAAWIGTFIFGWEPGGNYGAINWHAHELLFGYAAAALAGFMLTAVPNWTGRLPVAGGPLLGLVALWLAGRVMMLAPDTFGMAPALIVDGLFFVVLASVAAREILAGKNWRNLPVVAAVSALGIVNAWFHWSVLAGGDTGPVYRTTILIWVMLIALIGGRLGVSFTRNWLVKQGGGRLPAPFDRVDRIVLALTFVALTLWVAYPENWATGTVALAAAVANLYRLRRWQGLRTWREPLVLVLHTSYAFIPLGLAATGLSAFGLMSTVSALHLLTVGAIANMTVAVMTRATRGHTGRPLTAGRMTTIAFVCLALSALMRPAVDAFPEHYLFVVEMSALLWLVAYALFVIEYAPMLLTPRPGR